MENLFMQIFESRDAVTAQIRQQGDSYAQSLARAFHLNGHRPPPWLLPPCAAATQEVNGKPIIPEFLFAGSQIATPATSRTVFLPRAVPSTSFRSVGVPNEYVGLETICDTLDASQHEEVPQRKQVSGADQELAEASSEVNMFSVVKRSRSRQRRIEDCSREKDQGTKSGISDAMQDRMQRSEHAAVGSKRRAASLSSKPFGDGANDAGTRTSLPGQENSLRANEGRSTESFTRSKDGDLGNQGVQLDFSQDQIASSDNNVKVPNNCPVRNLLEVQVTGSAPVTHLSVEPKKLQFDAVESVCMNPASEQTMQQADCDPESANIELAEADSLNEVQVTGSVGVPSEYVGLETICDTLDANQHEVPQQKQVSADQELAEASSEVNMFSVVNHSMSRQRRIEDCSREKDQETKSGISDAMQDRIQRSEHATVGSKRRAASLSSKPFGDGTNNAGTRTSLLGQENSLHANEGRSIESFERSKDGDLGNQGVQLDFSQNQIASSDNNVKVPNTCSGRLTESFKRSKDGDLGNQGVQLDFSQNQIASSDNNVKVPNNCPVRNLLEVQVTGSAPVTHLSVEPKKLQFDAVESVCMNPASEQIMQQPDCAPESANIDLAEADSLNEVQVTGSVGVPNEYVGLETICDTLDANQLEVPQQKQVSADQELAEASSEVNMFSAVKHSRSRQRRIEDCSREKDQGTKSGISDAMQDRIQRSEHATVGLKRRAASLSSKPFGDGTNNDGTRTSLLGQENSLHANEGRSTESFERSKDGDLGNQGVQLDFSQNQLASSDNNIKVPNNCSGRLTDLLEEDGCEDLSHSLINDGDRQSSQFRSAACPEKLRPQTGNSIDVGNTSISPYKTQSNGTHSNGCPVANASVSEENEVSQEQHFLARTSLELNEADVGTPLGHASPGSQNETLDLKPAHDAVNCNSGNMGDDQVKFSSLTKACDISVSNKMDESAVPEVMSCISARRTSEMHTTERNRMTSAKNLLQEGTEEDTPLLENAVKENTIFCTAYSDELKSSQPSIQYLSRSEASHEKIDLAKSDKSSASYDQKGSVQDGFEVNGGLSSKRRIMRSQSDFDLSSTPRADSLSLNHQVGISGDMLTTRNFSEKSQLSGRYFLRSSGSCMSMSLDSEVENAVSNCKISVASDVYGNRNSSRGRRKTTSLLNVVLDNSPSASTSRSTMEGRLFENSQEQIQNNSEVELLTASLPCCSGILSHNEENCTQQEDCLQGQDLSVNNASVADQEMALQMDNVSSPIAISNPEKNSGAELFPVLSSYTLDKHGEQASAPNALFHEKLCYASTVKLGRKYKSYDPKGHLSGSAISRQLDDESFECDDTMPEFESFDIPVEFVSPTSGKRPSEDLYDSNAASGVWGTLSGKPRNYSFSDDLEQYSASDSRSIMGSFGCGLELDTFFISEAAASCSSDANSRQEINETPLTPSVEKYSLRKLSSRSRSGSEHMGSIPELECFRIDEEDEFQDRSPGSVDGNCLYQQQSGRKALQDITELCQNNGNSPSLSTRCMDADNIDLTAECFSSELKHHSNIRKDNGSIKPKGSHPTSVKRGGKVSRSLQGRFGTAEKLNSRNVRHRSEANVDRQSKPSNIVANMTSFIPLVKQKLQPTTGCVKKGVKVKALKAAEAAKRLDEKKQKEQEIRKAAAKAERERLKCEKEQKQKLEEEQKKKRDEEEKKKRDEDEQKKKREVDAATKKRQREEGEKRETMKKRKCIDEARKQQKQPMDRRRGTKDEKDARQKASDAMEPKKNLVDVGKNQANLEETTEPALRYKGNKSMDEKAVALDERPASFGTDAKENIPNSFEQSYDMSPFKDSDDEDGDDFEDEQESRRRLKFVPSWARKENLDKILLSNIALDPREIFARKLSFNISDVFSAYIPQRGLR